MAQQPLTPIGRWSTVPYQRINPGNPLNVGVVAFSKNGIDRIEFTLHKPEVGSPNFTGASPVISNTMSHNPQSGVYEYWIAVSADDFDGDGQITIEAVVYGSDGGVRDKNTGGGQLGLDPLRLNINKSGSLEIPEEFWVSTDGNDDTGQGTESSPLRTIGTAIQGLAEWHPNGCDGAIIRLKPGVYPATTTYPGWQTYTKCTHEWLTITTGGGDASDTIIEGKIHGWPAIHADGALIRFTGLTIRQPEEAGYPTIHWSQLYPGRLDLWFDSCRFEGAGRFVTGWEPMPYQPLSAFKHVYLTDTTIQDVPLAVNGPGNGGAARSAIVPERQDRPHLK